MFCTLCNGSAGSFNADGDHNLCAVLAKHGMPTPSLGDRCAPCNGSGTTGKGPGPFLDLRMGDRAIARSIAATFPPCEDCRGTGVA